MLFYRDLSEVFFMTRLGLWILGRKTEDLKCLCCPVLLSVPGLDVGLERLAEVVCQISPLYALEGERRVQPTPE